MNKKIKCEDCFKREDKAIALKNGWKHYADIKINGETLKQDNWICPRCIPYNTAGVPKAV